MRARIVLVVVIAAAVAVASVASVSLASRGRTASTVVLGSEAFAKPSGAGWGTAQPRKIYNGGDPSGLVSEIQWTGWGGPTAVGYGIGSIFKPHGGYYSQPVLTELRATGLGQCTPGGPPAYTRLSVRTPVRPEGPYGPWSLWSGAKTLCKFDF
jgi:hypothetical protein